MINEPTLKLFAWLTLVNKLVNIVKIKLLEFGSNKSSYELSSKPKQVKLKNIWSSMILWTKLKQPTAWVDSALVRPYIDYPNTRLKVFFN